jgi:hypothetical protein
MRARIAFAISIFGCVARAASGQTMTFKTAGFEQVAADGEITADTPVAFSAYLKTAGERFPRTVLLNSLGGDLDAGLALGREIRAAGWNTSVARPGLSFLSVSPGECDSACTFVFLGGKVRSMPVGSYFGVHRFTGPMDGDLQQSTQQLAGQLVAFIREMGVSSEMYTLMTEGAPKKVKFLDVATMARLRIITTETVTVNMADENGVAVVHLTDADNGGTSYGHLDFYCNGPRLLMRTYFSTPPVEFSPSLFSLKWAFITATDATEHELAILPEDYRYLGKHGSEILIDVNVSASILQAWMLNSRSIGAKLIKAPGGLLDIHQDRVGSVTVPLPSSFRTLVQTMERACH